MFLLFVGYSDCSNAEILPYCNWIGQREKEITSILSEKIFMPWVKLT